MKHPYQILFLIALLFLSCKEQSSQVEEIAIIPKPLYQKIEKGVFILDGNVQLISTEKLNEVSNYFEAHVRESYQLEFSKNESDKKIIFKLDESILNEEGYKLTIEKNIIEIIL